MTNIVYPGMVSGTLQANASKSAMQRACAAALVAGGETHITSPGNSNDDRAALDIILKLGAEVQENTDGTFLIKSKGVHPAGSSISCGESGLSIRMFTPLAALCSLPITIEGEGSLTVRPMDFFDEILPKLSVKVKSNGGRLPLMVQGPLQPANIVVDGSLSSQFLTGLLLAFGAANAQDITLTVTDLKSKPYIDLTLQIMQEFGLPVPQNKDYQHFYFPPNTHKPVVTRTFRVEGDWSGGSFLLVAAAIAGGEVTVEGLMNNSKQADKKIIDALLSAGAYVKVYEDKVTVRKDKLIGFDFDATDCPDLFPPLVALAALCKGSTRIRGLKRLKHKESDRGVTLQEEFDKLNVAIALEGDIMTIIGRGRVQVNNQRLNSHHDHRIAMAVAVAALCGDFEVEIRNADAVNKSYPDFWNHLSLLGARVENL